MILKKRLFTKTKRFPKPHLLLFAYLALNGLFTECVGHVNFLAQLEDRDEKRGGGGETE